MPEKRNKVLITREIPEKGTNLLEDLDAVILGEGVPERKEVLEAVKGVFAILSTVTEKMDAEVMDAAGENLRIVANMAVGFDNVDVEAATERNIVVTNTPGVLDETTADTAFMLLLAAARRLGEAERMLRAGEWDAWGPKQMIGPDVFGKMLGIVGFGRIGEAVARRAKGFGMEIFYNARSRKEDAEKELDARRLDLDDLLRECDFVSIHTPLTDETKHLIGGRELAMMKSESVLVNTSRGSVVDEEALAEALENELIFAAGLDVYEEEPKVHPRLLELENVVLAPHIGSASIETRNKMAVLAAKNISAVLRGEAPPNPVN